MPDKLPGGYRFFLFGQLFEGVLGGRVMLSSILAAYITDTSPLGLRLVFRNPSKTSVDQTFKLRTVNLGINAGLDMLGNVSPGVSSNFSYRSCYSRLARLLGPILSGKATIYSPFIISRSTHISSSRS